MDGQPCDGPFIESKELIAGYTLINVKSKQEAAFRIGPSTTRGTALPEAHGRIQALPTWM